MLVALYILETGGRGRLQAKHWFIHQYQCDVTSHIGDFQYGERIRCTFSPSPPNFLAPQKNNHLEVGKFVSQGLISGLTST